MNFIKPAEVLECKGKEGFYIIRQKTIIENSYNELSYAPVLAEKYVEPK